MLTAKQRDYVESIERNTAGLTAISTGPCPGCEQCRDEYGIPVPCECKARSGGDFPDCEACHESTCTDCPLICDNCDGRGNRPPTMAEFEEQWHNGETVCEGSFSHQGCDLCGSSLRGTMEPWHAIDANGEIIHGEHACVDCALYLANGDLTAAVANGVAMTTILVDIMAHKPLGTTPSE